MQSGIAQLSAHCINEMHTHIPYSANTPVSTQSKPAPALAITRMLVGSNSINSLSHRPISPPVFQKGRMIAEKSPHVRSCRCFLKAERSREVAAGLMMVYLEERREYRVRL